MYLTFSNLSIEEVNRISKNKSLKTFTNGNLPLVQNNTLLMSSTKMYFKSNNQYMAYHVSNLNVLPSVTLRQFLAYLLIWSFTTRLVRLRTFYCNSN
jgi:hypothetical protein